MLVVKLFVVAPLLWLLISWPEERQSRHERMGS